MQLSYKLMAMERHEVEHALKHYQHYLHDHWMTLKPRGRVLVRYQITKLKLRLEMPFVIFPEAA